MFHSLQPSKTSVPVVRQDLTLRRAQVMRENCLTFVSFSFQGRYSPSESPPQLCNEDSSDLPCSPGEHDPSLANQKSLLAHVLPMGSYGSPITGSWCQPLALGPSSSKKKKNLIYTQTTVLMYSHFTMRQ